MVETVSPRALIVYQPLKFCRRVSGECCLAELRVVTGTEPRAKSFTTELNPTTADGLCIPHPTTLGCPHTERSRFSTASGEKGNPSLSSLDPTELTAALLPEDIGVKQRVSVVGRAGFSSKAGVASFQTVVV